MRASKEHSRARYRLSPAKVSNPLKPGIYHDGGGLRLVVSDSGRKRWVLRITANGQRRDIALGSLAVRPLKEAREEADRLRRTVELGGELRRTQPGSPSLDPPMLFEQCWRNFWDVKKERLSNGKHVAQWQSTMAKYVLPKIGKRPVADIKPGEILDLIRPIWGTKEETARRILQRVDAVFTSAIVRENRDKASPCTGIAKELGKRRRRVMHHAALPHADVPGFMRSLTAHKGCPSTRLAFAFLTLTCTRSGETRGARWAEIDMVNRTWTIPSERMKSRREHIVPLSDAAVSLLEQARTVESSSELVFPSTNGRTLSDMVFTKFLRDRNVPATAHGFRTSFKVWAASNEVLDEVSEAALAHVDENKVRAAYRRTTFFEERKIVANRWSAFVMGE